MSKVWEQSVHAGTELLMLLAVADFSDDDGQAYPSVATLARKCRMKPRNCRYILKALEQSGELSILADKGIKGTNLYRINILALGVQHSAGVQCIAGVQHSAGGGAIQRTKGVQPIAPKPSVNHQEPSTPRKSVDSVPPGFAEFWNAYGKKNGKANSIQQWKKLKPNAELVQTIVSAATIYSASTEPKYRKDPERWLKDRRWEDGDSTSGASPDFMAGAL